MRRVFVAAVARALLAAGPAQAHIQVSPTQAAPGDPVLFQLLVPNERARRRQRRRRQPTAATAPSR
jgi:hypothetical protein